MAKRLDRLIVLNMIKRLLRPRGFTMENDAKLELNRLVEIICLEATVNARMKGRTRVKLEDVRRCPTCDRDRTMGTLKL